MAPSSTQGTPGLVKEDSHNPAVQFSEVDLALFSYF